MTAGEAPRHRQGPLRLALLDEPWQRFPLVVVIATLFWCLVLAGLGFLLQPDASNVSHLEPLEAQIIEVPTNGLAGGGGGSPAASGDPSTPTKSTQPPAVKPSRHRPRTARARAIQPPPPEEPNAAPEPKPTESHVAAAPVITAPPGSQPGPAAAAAGSNGTGGKGADGEGGVGNGIGTGIGNGLGPGSGTGSGGGFGTGGTGPKAIYAPAPTIPDDMREEVLEAVAIVHFKVFHDGRVIVSLAKPTDFSRLNEVILDTLREWRFHPAMNKGVAVDSEAEVRLLIKVQ
jgi:periplasmic protein TonB